MQTRRNPFWPLAMLTSDSKAVRPEFSAPFFGVVRSAALVAWLACGLMVARSQPAPVGETTPHLASGTNVDDPGAPLKDSLTERGSHNFSDMGSWIWDTNVCDRQTVLFWRSFEIPSGTGVSRARLRITADNEYILYLDGQELGRDAEWRHLYEYDITALLGPGKHVLAVDAYNSSREAGFMFGMQVGLTTGQVVRVKSDSSWLIVPEAVAGWQNKTEPGDSWRNAVVESDFGLGPWGVMDYIDLVPPMQPVFIPFWQTAWFEVLLISVCGVVSLVSFSLMTKVLLQRNEQQSLLRERARIARDIHDDLGTRVTQLVLQGEVAQSELPAGSKTRGQLERISEEAREALRAMDEILWAINPRRDTLHEFATFVCSHAQTFLKATPIQCVLDVEPAMSTTAFDLPFRRSLLMAVKEALNNAAKHSEATELMLQIHRRGSGLIVAVQDNGKGFDPARSKAERNGLNNMHERLNEVGGTCVLTSQPGEGCRIEFYIPFIQMRRRPWWLNWRLGRRDQSQPVRNATKN